MVYKSKKINRRRYLKGLQKKQSRTKKYGGAVNDINNAYNNNNAYNINNANNNANIKPSLSGNFTKIKNIIFNLANKLAANGIKTVEYQIEAFLTTLGMDTNADVRDEVTKILIKIIALKNALETEEGKKALSDLGSVISNVSKEVVAPGLTQIADRFIEHSGKMAKNTTNAAMDAFTATPAGIILEVPKLLSDVGKLAVNSVSLANDLTEIIRGILGKGKEHTNEFKNAFSQINSLLMNGNEFVQNGLTQVEGAVDSYVTEANPVNEKTATNALGVVQRGGLLNNYRHQAQMIGGRIREAQSEFLEPALKRKTTLRKR